MKTVKFDGKDYNVPCAWQEVTVGMLIKTSELDEILDDAPLIAILSAYTGIPLKELKHGKSAEVQEILAIMDFISTPYVPQPRSEFEYNDKHYECQEDLIDQSFEDFVSIQTCLYNNRDEPTKGLARLLAIYCKQEGETLSDFNLSERAKLFEGLSMTIAKDIEAFFLVNLNAYKGLSILSSIQGKENDIVQERLKELRNTVKAYKGRIGGYSLMKLQIGLFQIYLWLWQRELVKSYSTPHISNSKKIWTQTCKKLHLMKPRKKLNK
jgi:hypothetical protein